MKTLRAARNKYALQDKRPDDDPVTVVIRAMLDPVLFELRRWQPGKKALAPKRKGVTWCKGWGGPAAQALAALVALDESREA